MTFGESIHTVVIRKYATFDGRAPRSEFWWFQLFSLGISIILAAIGTVIGSMNALDTLDSLISLALLIPTFAVTFRRLYDIDRSGWWQFLPVTSAVPAIVAFTASGAFDNAITLPFIAATAVLTILLIVWLIRPGDAHPNRFGDDPLHRSDAEVFR